MRQRFSGILLPVLLAMLGCGFVYELVRHLEAAGDFWTFWAAARAMAAGLDPYVPASLTRVAALPPGPAPGPFLSPLVVAEAMAPLGRLPFAAAQRVWLALNLGLSGVLLVVLLRLGRFRLRWPTLLGGAALLAAFQAYDLTLWLGQTDVLVVTAIAAGWLLQGRGRPFLGGLVTAAAAVDVHLVAGFGLYALYVAVVRGRWRGFAGLVSGLAVLAAACLLHPAAVGYWLTVTLPHAQRAAIEPWDTLSVLQAGSELLGRGGGAVLALGIDLAMIALAWVAWGRCHAAEMPEGELAVAAALTAATATFAYNQDFLLLVLAFPFLARLWRSGPGREWLGPLALLLAVGFGLAELTGGPVAPGHAAFILGAPLLALGVVACLPGMAARLRPGDWAWAAAWAVLTLAGYGVLTVSRWEIGAELLMLAGVLAFIVVMAMPEGPLRGGSGSRGRAPGGARAGAQLN